MRRMRRSWFSLCLFVFVFAAGAQGAPFARSKVDLQEARLSAGYKQMLDTAFVRLGAWCVEHGEPLPVDLQDEPRRMSDMLALHEPMKQMERFATQRLNNVS